jgi:hypothetical protein
VTDEQFLFIAHHLARQTELLEAMIVALVPEAAPEESDECQHPDEQRVSLATPARPDHWICSACKHEHTGIVHN